MKKEKLQQAADLQWRLRQIEELIAKAEEMYFLPTTKADEMECTIGYKAIYISREVYNTIKIIHLEYLKKHLREIEDMIEAL